MRSISPRLGGLCTGLVVAIASAVGAAPASATVTHTNITSPTGGSFYADLDSPDPQVIHVTGTSDGNMSTDSDTVDIICVASSSSVLLESGVPVNDDGTFSTDAPLPTSSSYRSGSCDLKAVDNYSSPSSRYANFTGPHINIGHSDTYQNTSGGPSDGTTYDWDVYTAQSGGGINYESAGDCGISYSWLFSAGHGFYSNNYWTGPWDCNGFFSSNDQGLYRGSDVTVDGHNAYLPSSAEQINSNAAGLPAASLTRSVDQSTGDVTFTDNEALAYCANADNSINDDYGPSCDHFAPAPVTLTRTTVQNNAGRQVTTSDDWKSTDGASHPVRLQYEEEFNYCYFQLPGQSSVDECENQPGQEVTLPAQAPQTIYVHNYPGDYPSDDQVGALTYFDKPDRVVFDYYEGLRRVYNRTVPATGALTEKTVYSSGMTPQEAAALAQAAQGATSSPSVAITSPANGAQLSKDFATVTGTATDDQGVTSLTVDGLVTPVNGDGTWSQTIPLNPGANTITATAKDSGGNATTVTETVFYSPPAAPSCTVPKVGGMTKAQATTALTAAGCTLGKTTSAPSSHVKKGHVLSQGSKSGAKVPAYYPVNLVISSGRLGKAHLAHRTVSVRKGKIRLQVICPKADGNPCNGSLKIRTTSGKHMTLGTHAFQTPAGKRRSVTFTLSKSQRSTLAKEGTVRAQVYILARNVAGKATFTKVSIKIKG